MGVHPSRALCRSVGILIFSSIKVRILVLSRKPRHRTGRQRFVAVSYIPYDGPVAWTTELGDTPTPAGEEQEAFTVFFNPDLIGGTFVRLQATLPSEELTTSHKRARRAQIWLQ